MKKGFTLVELIVVVGIVALISSVTLINFPSFRGKLIVDREVGKIGVALRKAQQYSSGVRRFEETLSTNPDPINCKKGLYEAQYPAYGLSVSMSNPKKYYIYADPNCDRISANYSSGLYTDLVETNLLEQGISIQDICINIDSSSTCSSTNGGVPSSLDVWYVRPNPTLIITVDGAPDATIQSAKIIIKGEDGSKKSVTVRKTGQISVQNEP